MGWGPVGQTRWPLPWLPALPCSSLPSLPALGEGACLQGPPASLQPGPCLTHWKRFQPGRAQPFPLPSPLQELLEATQQSCKQQLQSLVKE